jgi:hypothetical protein
VPNIGRLFAAASQAGLPIVISPHYYYPHDHQWEFAAPGERLMYKLHMFDRPGALSLEGFSGSGADRMPEFKESDRGRQDHRLLAAQDRRAADLRRHLPVAQKKSRPDRPGRHGR